MKIAPGLGPRKMRRKDHLLSINDGFKVSLMSRISNLRDSLKCAVYVVKSLDAMTPG